MPGNIITINGVSEFYVSDPKMKGLLSWLVKHGSTHNKEAKELLKELNKALNLHCERCDYDWIRRQEKLPRLCPQCNSPYWDRPRKKKIGAK